MVHEGVLTKVSGGATINSPGSVDYVPTYGDRYTRVKRRGDIHHGTTRREFVEIGGTRVHGLMLSPLYDELLIESVGQEVALSVIRQKGRRLVVAIRTPDGGLHKPSLIGTLFGMLVGLIWAVIGTAFFAAVAFIPAAILTDVETGVLIAAAVGVLLLLWVLTQFAVRLRARAALG